MGKVQSTTAATAATTWDGNTMSQNDMMEKDTVIVLDTDDNVIGSASKKGSHQFNKDQPRGILHRAFSVFMFDEETGELLLQKRASSKITFPNVWTNTCCSHPLHGMVPNEVDKPSDVAEGSVMGAKHAAIRKLDHELGIPAAQVPIEKFKFLTRLHYWAADTVTHGKKSPWGEHEIDYVLFILVDKNTLTVKPHPDEVDEVMWVSKSQLIEKMKEGLWSPWFRLIANRWLTSKGGWWDDLSNTMNTNDKCDFKTIHKFDPPPEHMGGEGDAGPLLGTLKPPQIKPNTTTTTTTTHTITPCKGNHAQQMYTRSSRIYVFLSFFFATLAIALGLALATVTTSLPSSSDNPSLFQNMLQFAVLYLRKLPQDFELAVTFSVLSILTSLYSIFTSKSKLLAMKMNMPQIPHTLPFFGPVKDFLVNAPWDLITNWHVQYGPIFSFTLLGRTCVAVSSPKYIQEIFQPNAKKIKKDIAFAYKSFMPILGTGIVTSDGKTWLQQRLRISHILRFDILDDVPNFTLVAVQNLYKKLDQAALDGSSVELGEELRHLTLQVISATFLSLSANETNLTFARTYLPIVEEANKRVWNPVRSFCFFMPSFWTHKRNCARLNDYVSSLIFKRWDLRNKEKEMTIKSNRREDVLDRILAKYELDNVPWNETTILQIRDEIKTFALAGHETSAAMMTWAMYELIINDDLASKVTNESITVFGDKHDWSLDHADTKDLPSREDLSELNLCEACLKESLRKYSVIPTTSRLVIEDTKVGQHVIPKGTSLLVSIQRVHQDPNIWPDPMKFDPMRFCEPSPIPAPYTFLPFIQGPRNCLGQHFALLESKMVLGMLLQRYEFTLKNPIDGNPKHRFMVPVVPKAGIHVTVRRRFN